MPLCCRQQVDRAYPRWGASCFLTVAHRETPLHVLWRAARGRAEGGILLVHGMNEYVGRYRHVAGHFGRRFHVAGVDLHAHGLTNPVLRDADAAIRGGAEQYDARRAFLAQADLGTLDPMRADFRRALGFLRSRCRGPLFVLAHSLGCLVAASALLDDPEDVAGILLVGPAFGVSRLPGWRGRLANPLIDLSFRLCEGCLRDGRPAACLAVLPIEAGMEAASLPGLRRLLSPCRPHWVPFYLTDWEEERERLRQDGYLVARTLLRYVLGIEKEIVRFRKRMRDFRLPYFLVYARGDPITAAWGNTDFVAATLNHPLARNRVLALDVPYHEQLFMAPPTPRRLLAAMDAWLAGWLSRGRNCCVS